MPDSLTFISLSKMVDMVLRRTIIRKEVGES